MIAFIYERLCFAGSEVWLKECDSFICSLWTTHHQPQGFFCNVCVPLRTYFILKLQILTWNQALILVLSSCCLFCAICLQMKRRNNFKTCSSPKAVSAWGTSIADSTCTFQKAVTQDEKPVVSWEAFVSVTWWCHLVSKLSKSQVYRYTAYIWDGQTFTWEGSVCTLVAVAIYWLQDKYFKLFL